MTGKTKSGGGTAFESFTELRGEHQLLLDRVDERLELDPSIAGEASVLAELDSEVRRFLDRGAAAGVFLEETRQRTACQVLLDYWVSSLLRAGRRAPRVRLAAFDGALLPDLNDTACPYVGLEAFRESTFFFGREADTQRLVDKIQQTPLVVVLGASGSGKSSLVLGGAIPALERLGIDFRIPPPVVPGNSALDRFAHTLLGLRTVSRDGTDHEAMASGSRGLDLLAAIAELGAPPAVVVIDQFEEVFTLTEEGDRETLAGHLATMLDADQGHRVILTMREEFRNRMVELRALENYLGNAYYSMRPMGYDELRAAVEKPAAMVNLQYQTGIVDELVKDVLGQSAALPLLQFNLRELWEKRDRNRITWEVYRKVGGPLEALRASAESFYGGLAPETQDEIRRILVELVRVDELLEAYRQPVPKQRLLAAGKANTEKVLSLLAENDYIRLTSSSGSSDAMVVEVKHEALIRNWPRYVGWIDEKRIQQRQRLVLTQATKRWFENGKHDEDLLGGWHLEEAKRCTDLSPKELEFIEASVEALEEAERQRIAAREREAAQRRDLEEARRRREEARQRADEAAKVAAKLRIRALGLAVLLGVALVTTFLAWRATKRAEVESLKNKARLQAIEAIAELQSRPLESLRLAVEANISLLSEKVAPDASIRQSLREVLSQTGGVPLVGSGEFELRRLAISPKGGRLAASDGQGTIRIWNIASDLTAAPLMLEGHKESVEDLAWSPDGLRLASASVDGSVRLWDLNSDAAPSSALVVGPKDRQGAIVMLAFEPGGNFVAGAGGNGTLWVWLMGSPGEPPKPLRHVHVAQLEALAFSPDGEFLATAGNRGRIDLWHTKDLVKPEATAIELHPDGIRIRTLAFSAEGRRLAAGTTEDSTLVWDLEERALVRAEMARRGEGGGLLAFGADGKSIATADSFGNLKLWDLAAISGTPIILGNTELQTASISFSPDGRWLATGSWDGIVRLWRIGTGDAPTTPRLLRGHEKPVNELAWSSDSRWFVSSSLDPQVRLWDAASPAAAPDELHWHRERVNALDFSTDGAFLALASDDRTVTLWNLSGKPPRSRPRVLPEHPFSVVALELSPDDRWLATRSRDGTAFLWDLVGIDVVEAHPVNLTPPSGASCFSFSPDSRTLAVGGAPGTIDLWNLETGEGPVPERRLEGHRGPVKVLAFSPGGALLGSGSEDDTARLWSLGEGSARSTVLRGHDVRVSLLAFSGDGDWLASGGSDDSVRLWDLRAPDPSSEPKLLPGHGTSVGALAFQPGGLRLATAGQNGVLRLWDLSAADPATSATPLAERDSGVRHLVFSQKGDLLAITTSREVRLWAVGFGLNNSVVLPGARASGSALAFSPDGRWLAAGGGRDGTAQLFRVGLEELIAQACKTSGWTLLAKAPRSKLAISDLVADSLPQKEDPEAEAK